MHDDAFIFKDLLHLDQTCLMTRTVSPGRNRKAASLEPDSPHGDGVSTPPPSTKAFEAETQRTYFAGHENEAMRRSKSVLGDFETIFSS